MRPEWRLVVGAGVALALGTMCAEPYARMAMPYYNLVARWIAAGHPWQIIGLDIAPGQSGPGAVLRLTGAILGGTGDAQPAATLTSSLQVAAVVEAPLIYWTCLLLWPATCRERLARLLLGIPLFLGLEAATTACQLLDPFAYGSAVLAGASDPVTSWELWTRFLESGGRVVVPLCAAILGITAARALLSYASRYAR
jgi:hypothetical protein